MSGHSWSIERFMERWSEPREGDPPPAAPPYSGRGDGVDAMLCANLRAHMTDEGWQLQESLRLSGYRLFGDHGGLSLAVPEILREAGGLRTLVVQDRREWEPSHPACFDKQSGFVGWRSLANRDDIFKLSIVKDAQHDREFHHDTSVGMGIHAWIHYYHPRIVAALCPWIRPRNMIRVWHTVDRLDVPVYSPAGRGGCLLSGAMTGRYYPLRLRLKRNLLSLPDTHLMPHPGYGVSGSVTPRYLASLARFKVAICTASVYGYSLRKITEATACGCVVITDLPAEDAIPAIDGNLIRIPPDASIPAVAEAIREACDAYDPERQAEFARLAIERFDYRTEGQRLATAIEQARREYASGCEAIDTLAEPRAARDSAQ